MKVQGFVLSALLVISQSIAYSLCNNQITSPANFKTWVLSFETESPILYPKNDAELSSFVSQAKGCGLKVRVVGTAHSIDGVVHQKGEKNVVVINLADYVPPASWSWSDVDSNSKRIRIGAGRTFLDLYSIIRPQGYMLQSTTAGLFFSLGGVFMNPSVHGSTINADRLCTQLVALRVMKADGTFQEITDPAEVKKWRGSLGLLGIATALEIQLRSDEGYAQFYDDITIFNWQKSTIETWLSQQVAGKDGLEVFYEVFTDRLQALTLSFTGGPSGFNANATKAYYESVKQANPTLAKTGSIISDTNDIISTVNSYTGTPQFLGFLLAQIGFLQVKQTWQDNYGPNGPRDGYFVSPSGLVLFDNMQQFIRCTSDCITDGTIYQALTVSRNILRPIALNAASEWVPNLGIEFRIVTATDSIVLEHLQPGKYISFEIVNLRDNIQEKNEHGAVFKQLEQAWSAINPGNSYHHGKEWGFGQVGTLPRPYPFQSTTAINKFYSAAKRSEFISIMNSYDPTGVFRAGEPLALLGLSTKRFDPRHSSYQSGLSKTGCILGTPQCLSSCGCVNSIFQIFNQNYLKCSDAKFFGMCV